MAARDLRDVYTDEWAAELRRRGVEPVSGAPLRPYIIRTETPAEALAGARRAFERAKAAGRVRWVGDPR